jgi:hypothetical protein
MRKIRTASKRATGPYYANAQRSARGRLQAVLEGSVDMPGSQRPPSARPTTCPFVIPSFIT